MSRIQCPQCKGTKNVFFLKGEDIVHDVCDTCEGTGMVETGKGPLPFWKPGTMVRIKASGEVGEVDCYEGDGFYRVAIGDKDSGGYPTVHVEDLELLEKE